MIYYYTGTPGSGKSYHLAVVIYSWLSRGKNVISNFDVNSEQVHPPRGRKCGNFIYINNIEWMNNAYLSYNGKKTNIPGYSYIDGLINYAWNFHIKKKNFRGEVTFIEHQTLLVFDECHRLWNSRQWNRSDRLSWIDFFREHRKLGFDIILTSQDDKSVDKQIRSTLENELLHRKLFNFVKPKILGKFLRLICGREIFVIIERKYGMSSKKTAHLGTSFLFGLKKYYDFYNTSALFSTDSHKDFLGASDTSQTRDKFWGETLEEMHLFAQESAERSEGDNCVNKCIP